MHEPLAVDRKLRAVASAWRRWLRSLNAGEGYDDDPFLPWLELVSRDTFEWATALPDYDPLRTPLRRWLFCLLEQRVNVRGLAMVQAARRGELHVVQRPVHERFTLAELLRRALVEPRRRRDWIASFLECAPTQAQLARHLWERKAEMARRLGEDDPDALTLPGFDPAAHAGELLDATRDLVEELDAEDVSTLLTRALGESATEGWPGRLTLRSLADTFRETPLLDRLALEPERLPERVGGASFLRGFAALGAAFARAAGPTDQPFTVSQDPYGLREHELSAVFGLLPLTQAFGRRALGLGGERLEQHRRALAPVVLLEARARALTVRLRAPALEGSTALSRAFEENTTRAFSISVPGSVAGALWQQRSDDAQRYAGLLLGAARMEQLVEQHDEDWYRNPRAADQLRSETRLSPEVTCSEEQLERGAAALRRLLAPLFG